MEVRVVCATNRKLEQEIENGTFRSDLFYRINVVNLHLPPLRERASDIPDLVAYFLEYHNRKYNCRARPLSSELMAVLRKYHWPGNIRELENLIKRYVILGNEEVISADLAPRETDFFNAEIPVDGQISLKKLTRQAVRELERKVILKVLQNHHWNRKQAARALSISYRALLYKIRDAGLPSNRVVKTPGSGRAQAGNRRGLRPFLSSAHLPRFWARVSAEDFRDCCADIFTSRLGPSLSKSSHKSLQHWFTFGAVSLVLWVHLTARALVSPSIGCKATRRRYKDPGEVTPRRK